MHKFDPEPRLDLELDDEQRDWRRPRLGVPGKVTRTSRLPGPGTLPPAVLRHMEAAFGADFSQVRVRESTEASAVGARAFTRGNDIVFAPGQYDPFSVGGLSLLGHELTHVRQQAQGRVAPATQAKGVAINDDCVLEREADDLGARAARGERVSLSAGQAGVATGVAVQRKAIAPDRYRERMKKYKRGVALCAGPKTADYLRKLRAENKLTITDDAIAVCDAMSRVETGGHIGGVNTWDSAIVSIGFMQATLGHGYITRLMKRAPAGFAKHGVRFGSGVWKKGSHKGIWTDVRKIAGVTDPHELRSRKWAMRFFRASMEPDVVAALVREALAKRRYVTRKATKATGASNLWHDTTVQGWLTEGYNHMPAAILRAIRLARARGIDKQKQRTSFLDVLARALIDGYVTFGRERLLRAFARRNKRAPTKAERKAIERRAKRWGHWGKKLARKIPRSLGAKTAIKASTSAPVVKASTNKPGADPAHAKPAAAKNSEPGGAKTARRLWVLDDAKRSSARAWYTPARFDPAWLPKVAAVFGVAPRVDDELVDAVAAFQQSHLDSAAYSGPDGKIQHKDIDGKCGPKTRGWLAAAAPSLRAICGFAAGGAAAKSTPIAAKADKPAPEPSTPAPAKTATSTPALVKNEPSAPAPAKTATTAAGQIPLVGLKRYRGALRGVVTIGRTRCLVYAPGKGLTTTTPNVFVFFHGFDADYKLGGRASRLARSGIVANLARAVAGKTNVIAIAPQGVIDGGDTRKLHKRKGAYRGGEQALLRGGLKPLIDGVLGALGGSLRPRHIALAGHSAGARQGVARALANASKYKGAVSDITLMDGGYSPTAMWRQLEPWMFGGGGNKTLRFIWSGKLKPGRLYNRILVHIGRYASEHGCRVVRKSVGGRREHSRVLEHVDVINPKGAMQVSVLVLRGGGSHSGTRSKFMSDAVGNIGEGASGNDRFAARTAAKPSAAKPSAAKPSAAKPSAAKPSAARTVAPVVAPGSTSVAAIEHDLRGIQLAATKVRRDRSKAELIGKGRDNLVAEIKRLRAKIAALTVAQTDNDSNKLAALKKRWYLEISRVAPFYEQGRDMDVLERRGQYRLCGITSLSMVLETMGKSASDYKGSRTKVLAAAKVYRREIRRAVSKVDGKGAWGRLEGLRLPDFLELAGIAEMMRGTSRAAVRAAAARAWKPITAHWMLRRLARRFGVSSSVTKFSLDSSTTRRQKNRDYARLANWGAKHRNTVAGAIAARKRYQVHGGAWRKRQYEHKHRNARAALSSKYIERVLPVDQYKRSVLAKVRPVLDSGGAVIIHLARHYVRLQEANDDYVIVDDPGGSGRANRKATWAEARGMAYFKYWLVFHS